MAKKITIDPGATGSGWAIWNEEWGLLDWGVIDPPKEMEWERKAYFVVEQLERIVNVHGCEIGFIEYPAFYQAAGAGVAASGALVKLAWFVGLVCGTLPCFIELVTVGEWKGQLPKRVVIKRITRILGNINAKSHDWDAIGIGLFLKGDLK